MPSLPQASSPIKTNSLFLDAPQFFVLVLGFQSLTKPRYCPLFTFMFDCRGFCNTLPEAECHHRAGPNEETGEMRENTWRVSERWTDRSGQQTPSAGETRGAEDHG